MVDRADFSARLIRARGNPDQMTATVLLRGSGGPNPNERKGQCRSQADDLKEADYLQERFRFRVIQDRKNGDDGRERKRPLQQIGRGAGPINKAERHK
jgi:hypothetical protein